MNKNKEEEKTKTGEKTKQWKVGITEKGNAALIQFMEMVNKTSKRRVRIPEVLEFAVEKLNDKDIRKIQERVYTPDDKMEVMLDEYNQRNPDKPQTKDELKAAMIEMYEKQVLSKGPKNLKMEQQRLGSNIGVDEAKL